ncbi:type IV secretory system conjugative DNA transfer family protein [Streptomyces alboflavus]|uniref:type IV secretory system conjugative DNA transfer family protein n=1 Tax=Streptomyces alboflavus TaxID=67267 RepID=UPI000F657F11|nr:type IV secretory system conjugative DNA transfer family protein [Streptomyces alboflavus]
MSATGKRRGPGNDAAAYLLPAACLLFVLALALTWCAAAAGAVLDGQPAPPANPFQLPFDLGTGDYTWPGAWATGVLVGELIALTAAAVVIIRAVRRARRRRQPIDAAATHMGKGAALARLTTAGVSERSQRLGSDRLGVFLGRSVIGRQDLYSSVEDVQVDIWGPRTGKTTRKAIPAVMDHGAAPVLVTSNKRDIVDATRGPRAGYGQVSVFDPQDLIGEIPADAEPTWWWNPLTYVTDMQTAAELASHFAADSRSANASTDAYFEPSGQELLANLLMAAKLADRPITQVDSWLANPRESEPERILRTHGRLYEGAANAVLGILNAPDKQRAGVYGTARLMAAVLRDPRVTRWVTPPRDSLAKATEFDPEAFVRSSGDTLYLVSREGKGSAGALVTALTVAVCEAAEKYAARRRGGRLPRELLAVLDEAANVCRWQNLPNLYSHYGSRGILLMTILQSWAQGVEVWGENGMAKLWSSATIATYGGGVKDPKYLRELSDMIGPWEAPTFTATTQPGSNPGNLLGSNRSMARSSRSEEIVSVRDLGSLSAGRAILLASQADPTLIETVPWWEREWAADVRLSLAIHEPNDTP